MKMYAEGKSVAEMRETIIARYSKFGPSTDLDQP